MPCAISVVLAGSASVNLPVSYIHSGVPDADYLPGRACGPYCALVGQSGKVSYLASAICSHELKSKSYILAGSDSPWGYSKILSR